MTLGLKVIFKTPCPKGARLKMDKLLEELIRKYEVHLQDGLDCLADMRKGSTNYQTQFSINSIWRMLLKDLRELSDKVQHDSHKKGQ